MNTTLTILLLIALAINIVCDIVRLWTFFRTVEESKENVKETICKAVFLAYKDYMKLDDKDYSFYEYFDYNFDKYL